MTRHKHHPDQRSRGLRLTCLLLAAGWTQACAMDVADPEVEGASEALWLGTAWVHETSLSSPLAVPPTNLGSSVAIDGNTAVVLETGRAHVYERQAGQWQWQGWFTPSQGEVVYSTGAAVDGDTIALGVSPSNPNPLGYVDVLTRDGGGWSFTQMLEPTSYTCPPTGCQEFSFGRDLDMDGDTLVIGANRAGVGHGRAYVFELINGTWTQTTELVPPVELADANFGNKVAVEGDVIAIGQPGFGNPAGLPGSVHVFRRDGAAWAPDPPIEMVNAPGGTDYFGAALDLAAGRLAIRHKVGVQMFVDSGGGFAFQWEITASSNNFRRHTLALSPSFVVVGTGMPRRNSPGIVEVYSASSATPVLSQTLTFPDADHNLTFGRAVAVSGSRILAAAPSDTPMGAAHVFRRIQSPNLRATPPSRVTRPNAFRRMR